MKTLRNIKVPTGNILVVNGEKGNLECLSLGDYGREKNVKASFLGLENDIAGVPNGDIMPLEEKWVVTVSTQYGCSMGCVFCDVPKVGPGVNASCDDILGQVTSCLKLHPEVKHTKRLNVHYARMGEPTFNPEVIQSAYYLPDIIDEYIPDSHIHPVVSTMLPAANKSLLPFLNKWCRIKNSVYNGAAGLQFSINSTSDRQRHYLFNGNSLSLDVISLIGKELVPPHGRKYALNFAVADETIVDAKKLVKLFSPDKFMVKITPIHVTNATEENGVKTTGGYSEFTPYQEIEYGLKKEGFDVLVFVPSLEEDQGRITCGNAILSGTMPLCSYTEE